MIKYEIYSLMKNNPSITKILLINNHDGLRISMKYDDWIHVEILIIGCRDWLREI